MASAVRPGWLRKLEGISIVSLYCENNEALSEGTELGFIAVTQLYERRQVQRCVAIIFLYTIVSSFVLPPSPLSSSLPSLPSPLSPLPLPAVFLFHTTINSTFPAPCLYCFSPGLFVFQFCLVLPRYSADWHFHFLYRPVYFFTGFLFFLHVAKKELHRVSLRDGAV